MGGSRAGRVEMTTGEMGRFGLTWERVRMREEETDYSLLHQPKVLAGCLPEVGEEGRGC